MPNAKLVATGKPKVGGAVYRAPLGTPLPTNANDALDAAFQDMGYVSDAGVTSSNTRESESIKAWGGATVATPQTNYEDKWKAVFIEAKNMTVLKTVFGDANVSGSIEAGIVITANAKELEYASYVFDMILNGARKRVVLPNASISDIGDVVYVDNDVIGYDVTLAALPDEQENTHYEYIIADASTVMYSVTFDSDGGSAVASQRVSGGSVATEPAVPTKNGFTFAGWTLNGAAYDFSAPVTANITLVATWAQEQFTVTQNLTNVTSTFTDPTVASGATFAATLEAETGYTIDSVTVEMGGEDITATAYDDATGEVTISDVDGDIVITATAV